MRLAAYASSSFALAIGVIIKALHERSNFYSASVYLAQSNACLMILTNLSLLFVSFTMVGLQKLFYGSLRPIEVEQLYEKAWFAITETCLAMTIFREEVGGWFLIMFVSLLAGKVWSWIGEGRVEVLEQQRPSNPRLFHLRLAASLAISILFDAIMLSYSVNLVLQHSRPNMMIMFAFEFAVLLTTSLSTVARYLVSLREKSVIKWQMKMRKAQIVDARIRAQQAASGNSEPRVSMLTALDEDLDDMEIEVAGWPEKGRWIFYLDLLTDFLKLLLYLSFFCVLCMFYGMPIHIIRDVALTIRSFHKRIADFLRYRQATRDMNSRYPDASSEEVAKEDCCIICRENMTSWSYQMHQRAQVQPEVADHIRTQGLDERLRPKKLPCGHVLHFACLRSWLERQQICPTCRTPVLKPPQVQAHQDLTAQHRDRLQEEQGRRPNMLPQDRRQTGQRPAQNVFNFGPLRIAFGATGPPQEFPHPNEHLPLDPSTRAYHPHRTQNNDIHIRNGSINPDVIVDTDSALAISSQLEGIEQHMIDEINKLRLQRDELQVAKLLHKELLRLRLAQVGATSTNSNSDTLESGSRHPTEASANSDTNTPIYATTRGDPACSQEIAEHFTGLTVPSGWSLLPLRRITTESASRDSLVGDPPSLNELTKETHSRGEREHLSYEVGSSSTQTDGRDNVTASNATSESVVGT